MGDYRVLLVDEASGASSLKIRIKAGVRVRVLSSSHIWGNSALKEVFLSQKYVIWLPRNTSFYHHLDNWRLRIARNANRRLRNTAIVYWPDAAFLQMFCFIRCPILYNSPRRSNLPHVSWLVALWRSHIWCKKGYISCSSYRNLG